MRWPGLHTAACFDISMLGPVAECCSAAQFPVLRQSCTLQPDCRRSTEDFDPDCRRGPEHLQRNSLGMCTIKIALTGNPMFITDVYYFDENENNSEYIVYCSV